MLSYTLINSHTQVSDSGHEGPLILVVCFGLYSAQNILLFVNTGLNCCQIVCFLNLINCLSF